VRGKGVVAIRRGTHRMDGRRYAGDRRDGRVSLDHERASGEFYEGSGNAFSGDTDRRVILPNSSSA